MRKFIASAFALGFLSLTIAACTSEASRSEPAKSFDEACADWCKGYSAPGCNEFTYESCLQSCSFTKEQVLGDHCLGEYADLYGCMANLDVTCASPSDARPEDQCPAEQQRAIACRDDVGCNIFCGAAAAGDCGGSSEEECFSHCKSALPADTSCLAEYSLYRKCQGESLVCVEGKPTTSECPEQRESLVNCLGNEGTDPDPCAGSCFVARDDGCFVGDDATCRSQCGAMMNLPPDASGLCADALGSLKVCQGKHVVCQNGTLAPDPDACLDVAHDAAVCIASNGGPCLGWCWYRDVKGCGDGGGVEACRAACQSSADNNPSCKSFIYNHLICKVNSDVVCDPQTTLCQSHELEMCLLK